MRKAAIILDRDGTLIADGAEREHEKPEDIPLLPGVRAACEVLRACGFLLLGATNQACVGRGESTWHRQGAVCDALARQLGLDGWRICPHTPEDGCRCRKPGDGMMHALADTHDLDLARCWMVGDAETDVVAGRAAGMRTALLAVEPCYTTADYVFGDLLEFALFVARARIDCRPGARGF